MNNKTDGCPINKNDEKNEMKKMMISIIVQALSGI